MIWILFMATMALSPGAAALGVAAHECGHALQHARAYFLWHLLPVLAGSRSRE